MVFKLRALLASGRDSANRQRGWLLSPSLDFCSFLIKGCQPPLTVSLQALLNGNFHDKLLDHINNQGWAREVFFFLSFF